MVSAIARLESELKAVGVTAEVSGRPKHIYSIWKKMKGKKVDFDELYDVRAFRVIVDDIKDCYTVLSILNNLWTPIPKSLTTIFRVRNRTVIAHCIPWLLLMMAVRFEVQIRTKEMHQSSEFGVAAHWRYKNR